MPNLRQKNTSKHSFLVLCTPHVPKNSDMQYKNISMIVFAIVHDLVHPRYEESLKIKITINDNVVRILQHFGLTCWQYDDNISN